MKRISRVIPPVVLFAATWVAGCSEDPLTCPPAADPDPCTDKEACEESLETDPSQWNAHRG